jgi:hypothetical protein
MRLCTTLLILLGTAAPLPALAYSCAVSPAKDAVIIKTVNRRSP